MIYHKVMKTDKEIKALKIQLLSTLRTTNNPYFGLSLETLSGK